MANFVSQEDKNSIEYFWKEKADIKRWVGWDDFSKENPEFAKRVEEYERAIRNARILLKADIEALTVKE